MSFFESFLSTLYDYLPTNREGRAKLAALPRFLFIGYPQLLWKYFRYNLKALKQNKSGYLLGVLSCFVVVVAVTISITALNQIPIIFLRLAENSNGQFDFAMKNNLEFASSLNFTQVIGNIIDGAGESAESLLLSSPRVQLPSSAIMAATSCMHNGTILSYNDTDWTYNGFETEGLDPACKASQACASIYCTVRADVELILYHTDKERTMGFGRNWDFPTPKPGEIIISDSTARSLDLATDDWVLLQLQTYPSLSGVWEKAEILQPNVSTYYFTYIVPFRVAAIFEEDENYGKHDSPSVPAFTDYSSFLSYVANFSRAEYHPKVMEHFPHIDLNEYASEIFFNIEGRIQAYNKNDYVKIQDMALRFASMVAYFVGFDQILTRLPILVYLRQTRFFSLFLGLIINIVVTVLSVLSILLIYSLLLINVESRTFETGVLRMLGMQKVGVIQIVLMQAFFYSIPGLILGLIFGQIGYLGIYYALSFIFEAPLPKFITWQSVGIAVLLGVVIPIFSSLLPINRALGQNLTDALDSTRSKTKAVKYNIERAADGQVSWTLVAFGLACAVFGFGIYYAFPLSLLSFNITLLLYLFFGVLLGMLLGLVVLTLNLENFFEQFLSFIFFFWENSAIRALVLKNLVAHRIRNRKTTIMYSLSLGFIIFVSVSFKLQITTFKFTELQKAGSRLYISTTRPSVLTSPSIRFPLLKLCDSSPYIEDCAFVSQMMNEAILSINQPSLVNLGRYKKAGQNIKAITPNFFNVAGNDFLSTSEISDSGFDLSEQLYTERGSYRMAVGTYFRTSHAIDNLDGKMFVEIETQTEGFPRVNYYYMKPLAFLNSGPSGTFSQFPGTVVQDAYVSFPTYMALSNGTYDSVGEVPCEKMLIRLKSGITDSELNRLKREMRVIIQGKASLELVDVEDTLNPLNIATTVINFFFIFVTIVAIILCYFSLVSSMVTNINEQAKEIGILRAIGVGKFLVTRVYIYEAFILVMSASVMGIIIGLGVSYTMTLQQLLFTQLPLSFAFPWEIVLIVFVSALFCAFLSSCIPIRRMLRRSIVQILRTG